VNCFFIGQQQGSCNPVLLGTHSVLWASRPNQLWGRIGISYRLQRQCIYIRIDLFPFFSRMS